MANRVAIFIDGAYLDNVIRSEFQNARIDYQALSERMSGDSDILRTYYYDCLPYQRDPPTESGGYTTGRRTTETFGIRLMSGFSSVRPS